MRVLIEVPFFVEVLHPRNAYIAARVNPPIASVAPRDAHFSGVMRPSFASYAVLIGRTPNNLWSIAAMASSSVRVGFPNCLLTVLCRRIVHRKMASPPSFNGGGRIFKFSRRCSPQILQGRISGSAYMKFLKDAISSSVGVA